MINGKLPRSIDVSQPAKLVSRRPSLSTPRSIPLLCPYGSIMNRGAEESMRTTAFGRRRCETARRRQQRSTTSSLEKTACQVGGRRGVVCPWIRLPLGTKLVGVDTWSAVPVMYTYSLKLQQTRVKPTTTKKTPKWLRNK